MDKKIAQQAQELARLWGGFRAARVVLTANNYEVFEHLRSGKTADQVARILRTDWRATEILLDALASLGLLAKKGTTYRNSTMTNSFLVKSSPFYQGDMLRHADTLWESWSGLDTVLKTGLPNRTAPRNHEAFIKAMHNNASVRADEVVSAVSLRGVKRALDLGGGPGTYSAALARRGVHVTLFDLPNTIAIARELLRLPRGAKLDFLEGDFHINDIGQGYDLVLISHVFHSFSAEENQVLLKKVRRALNPGGKVAVQEFFLEKDHSAPASGALFSVNMLVNTDEGRSYSTEEMTQWLRKERFEKVVVKKIRETVLLTATRR